MCSCPYYRHFLFFLFPFFWGNVLVGANEIVPSDSTFLYRVKAQDNISQILFRLGFKPIYGKSGALKETLRINSRTISNHLVYPGEHLKIPFVSSDSNPCIEKLESGFIRESGSEACWRRLEANAGRKLRSSPLLGTLEKTRVSSEGSVDDGNKRVPAEASSENGGKRASVEGSIEEQKNKISEEVSTEETSQVRPKAQIESSPNIEKRKASRFQTGVSSGFFALKVLDSSNGTNGTAASERLNGYFLNWSQIWTSGLVTSFGLSTYSLKILPFEQRTLNNSSQTLSRLDFEVSQELVPDQRLGLLFFSGETLLYRAESTTVLTIDKLQNTGAGIHYTPQLISDSPLALFLRSRLGLMSIQNTSTYSGKDGYFAGIGFEVFHHGKDWSLLGRIEYETAQIDVSSVRYQIQDLLFRFGVQWDWGN